MFTFSGYVKEFPTIRIDQFRKLPDKPNPVVGFLSHVHSDHLQGLETWGKIPLYCSPTTRELLLRLEKYPHRMNFAKGIFESRKQHYKALKGVLKPIPLNTPTDVEVGLGRFLRVTVVDANHCAGAVMFLIEDEQKAILYTGDIRSETWWVNSLARNPVIIPYTWGNKRLDNMYLDTTFATKDERYRKFQPKAAGIKELLEEVSKYPNDTVFHFHAWTLGYEDVWIALSSALRTQVHVDDYKRRLYGSLAPENSLQFQSHEGPALLGFKNGNHSQKGCLTDDKSVRLHSCERGTGCPVPVSSTTVYITPIMSRGENGEILPEVGAGGGGGDLLQNHGYLELNDQTVTEMLINLCDERAEDPTIRFKVRDIIIKALGTDDKAVPLEAIALWGSEGDVKLEQVVETLVKCAASDKNDADGILERSSTKEAAQHGKLPCRIQFPYSRHSSYEELCELVTAFCPREIFPCTTDWQEWTWDQSIENLFGHLCSGMTFVHDQEMADLKSQRATSRGLKRPRTPSESHGTTSSQVEELPSSQESAGRPEKLNAHERQRGAVSDYLKDLTNPERRIGELRRSFERPLEAVKNPRRLGVSTPIPEQVTARPSSPTLTTVSSHPHLHDGDLRESEWYRSFSVREENAGTQAEPIKLSDEESLRFDSQGQGIFLLEDLPEPEDPTNSDTNGHSRPETQVTLSDATFESQPSNISPKKRKAQIKRRKQAYKAARDLNSAWAEEHGLVSSGADHGDEEVEL